MKSLTLRIFVWYWAASIVAVGGFCLLSYWSDPAAHLEHWRVAAMSAGPLIGQGAAHVYESMGPECLLQLLEPERDPHFTRMLGLPSVRTKAYLFDSTGRELTGRDPGAETRAAAREALSSIELVTRRTSHATILAWSVKGKPYAMTFEAPLDFVEAVRADPWPWIARFGAVEAAFVFMCFLLARTIAGPIGELRNATRAFAAGDLEARIDPARPWLKRCDSISGLARDFNNMAARISEHVESQQRLLRDISHELRSPLTRLGLATGLLRKRLGSGAPACDEYIARIEKESAAISALVDNTLAAARMQEAPDDQAQLIEPEEVLAGVISDASFEASSRGVTVIRSGSCPPVRGNFMLLRSAFDNVIRNAIRYTESGSAVEVELARKDGFAVIKVRDHGPGVPESSLPHLFDPFYRVEDSRDRDSGGAGLGLAIARAALQAHQGSAQASNRPDGGLEVEMRLPQRP